MTSISYRSPSGSNQTFNSNHQTNSSSSTNISVVLPRLISRLEVQARSQQQRFKSISTSSTNQNGSEKLWWDSVGLLASVKRASQMLEKARNETQPGGALRSSSSFEYQSLERRLSSLSALAQLNHSSLASTSSLKISLPTTTSNSSSSSNLLQSQASFQSASSSVSSGSEIGRGRNRGGAIASSSSSSLLVSPQSRSQAASWNERQAEKRKAFLTKGLDLDQEANENSRETDGTGESSKSSFIVIGTSNEGRKLRKKNQEEMEDPYDDFVESEDEEQPTQELQTTEESISIPTIKVSKEEESEDDEFDEYSQPSKSSVNQAEKSNHSYPPTQASPTSGGDDSLLQSDRQTQDALSTELLRMASRLKANSLSFAEALERDRKLVEATGEKLQGNLDLMTRTRGRLGEYAKSARSLGWFTFGSILVVIVSWVMLFIVIKLT